MNLDVDVMTLEWMACVKCRENMHVSVVSQTGDSIYLFTVIVNKYCDTVIHWINFVLVYLTFEFPLSKEISKCHLSNIFVKQWKDKVLWRLLIMSNVEVKISSNMVIVDVFSASFNVNYGLIVHMIYTASGPNKHWIKACLSFNVISSRSCEATLQTLFVYFQNQSINSFYIIQLIN